MELLKKLTEAVAPSGAEEAVGAVIEEAIRPYVDEVYTDALGNLIAHKKGTGKKIMLAAHMDEIGVMATYIDDNGFVRFSPIGWLPPHYALYKKVYFTNGVVGVVGYEEKEKDLKDIKNSDLYIDIGVSSKEEAESQIAPGISGGIERSFSVCGSRVFSGVMDNRSGCYCLIKTAERYTGDCDVYYVFTVQEEVGLRGAGAAAFSIQPDMALSVDVTDVGDTPNCPHNAVRLGEGPAIKVMDASIITHPIMRRKLLLAAEGLPYQLEVIQNGGTDAGAMHTSKGGVMTGAVSIPCRYIHSAAECVDTEDLKHTEELLYRFLMAE